MSAISREPVDAAGVRRVLELPAVSTLPGRAVLALDGWLKAEQHWQRTQPQIRPWRAARARGAARHAREFVPRLLGDPRLAQAPWRGYADSSASVVVDGLWLWYARGQVFLAVECPTGGDPHLARVHSLVELGELVAGATVAPPSPPWSCTALCPSPEPEPAAQAPAAAAGRVVFVVGSRAPTEGGLLDTRFVTEAFGRAREVLTGLLDAHVRMAFAADRLDQARELVTVADAVPSGPPAGGCWQAMTIAGARYWLHARTETDRGAAEGLGPLAATSPDGAP